MKVTHVTILLLYTPHVAGGTQIIYNSHGKASERAAKVPTQSLGIIFSCYRP